MEKREKNAVITREFQNASFREVEGEGNERKFILSFSSEEPYDRFYGTEILDHADGAADLTRLNEIGVLLFNHHRDKVMGKVLRAWISGGRGEAEVEFDTDAEAEVIYQKVKNKTLKTTSVGYKVESWEELMANKTSADGRFHGPASIARKWLPLEISIASVPADASVGVGRSMEEPGGKSETRSLYELQVAINKNRI